jgi:hypothetical protein
VVVSKNSFTAFILGFRESERRSFENADQAVALIAAGQFPVGIGPISPLLVRLAGCLTAKLLDRLHACMQEKSSRYMNGPTAR